MAGYSSDKTHQHLTGLDHLRALAIAFVILFHYQMFQHPAWVETVGSFGWTGVDLFFVLSGFLIAGQLFGKIEKGQGISLSEFFLKRVFRILPAYLVILGIYFLVPAFHEREALPPLWRFLSFTQNFGLDLRYHGTFSHAWSLCIEEQFYLLLPFILLLLSSIRAWRFGIMILLLLFLGTIILRFYIWQFVLHPHAGDEVNGIDWYKYIYYPTYTRLDGLVTGVAIAALNQYSAVFTSLKHRCGNVFFLLGILVLSVAWMVCNDEQSLYASVFGFSLVAIGYGFILVAAISPGTLLLNTPSRFTSVLAALSYSVYLSHKGLIHLVQPLLEKSGIDPAGNLAFLLSMGTCLAGALLLRFAVEKPFLRMRGKLLKKNLAKTPERNDAVSEVSQFS